MRITKQLLACFMISAFTVAGYAKEDVNKSSSKKTSTVSSRLEDCEPTGAIGVLDKNNVRTTIQVGGDLWWDFSNAKYEVPKVNLDEGETPINSIFAGSIWIGGVDAGGNLKLGAQTYRQGGVNDFFAGPLRADGTTDEEVCAEFDRTFKVEREDLDDFVADFGDGVLDDPVPASILNWPAKGNPSILSEFRDNELAPFHDEDGDGSYNPQVGDHPILQECDGEEIVVDQMIWWVWNDAGGIHTETEALSIGIEVQSNAFAFSTADALNNMTFYNYKLINKASTPLDSTFMGVWCDPDLGNYNDDYVGCNIEEGLGIVYNADEDDEGQDGYGTTVPMLGIDYFQGPTNEFGVELDMTTFIYYDNDGSNNGNPNGGQEIYNYFNAHWRDGTPITFGGNGETGTVPTQFMFPDDPTDAGGWSECSEGNPAADRRFLQASGPFRLEPGAVNNITIGVVWVPEGAYPCPTFAPLLQADQLAQALFDNCFKITDGPDAPTLQVQEYSKKIVLDLVNLPTSNNFLLGYQEKDLTIFLDPNEPDTTKGYYFFQGYQVFQSRTGAVPDFNDPEQARLVAQMDVKDGIKQLVNYTVDSDLGFVGTEQVNGADEGIIASLEITQDLFNSPSNLLVNNNVYYYTVIAYAYNAFDAFDPADPVDGNGQPKGQLKPYLRGRNNVGIYTVIPHDDELDGFTVNAQPGDQLAITKLDGEGNGGAEIQLVDGEDAEIANDLIGQENSYQKGFGPIDVRVVNPRKLQVATFELKMIDETLSDDILPNETTWELIVNGEQVASESDIGSNHQQYIIDSLGANYGISIRIGQVDPIGVNPEEDNNGFRGASLSDDSWLGWVTDTDDLSISDWIKSGTEDDDRTDVDNNEVYEGVLGGAFSPAQLLSTSNYGPGGGMSTSIPNALDMAQTRGFDLILTSDRSLWTKCAVVEMGIDQTLTVGAADQFGVRQSPSLDINGAEIPGEVGRSYFPGYAIDVESGRRLNIVFSEDSSNPDENGDDMVWNPTSNLYDGAASAPLDTTTGVPLAGMHYIYVMNSQYEGDVDGGLAILTALDFDEDPSNGKIRDFLKLTSWAAMPYLKDGASLNSADVKVSVRVRAPFAKHVNTGLNDGYPMYRFNVSQSMLPTQLSLNEQSSLALEQINVVPNPYYAISQFEGSSFEKRVRFTNLPPQATIRIFDLEGTLINQIVRNESSVRGGNISVDWNLQNFEGLPIGSGMYIIHFDVPGVGEKTIKWFAVNRINEIETF